MPEYLTPARCTKCDATWMLSKPFGRVAHRMNEATEFDMDGHHIAIRTSTPWCDGEVVEMEPRLRRRDANGRPLEPGWADAMKKATNPLHGYGVAGEPVDITRNLTDADWQLLPSDCRKVFKANQRVSLGMSGRVPVSLFSDVVIALRTMLDYWDLLRERRGVEVVCGNVFEQRGDDA